MQFNCFQQIQKEKYKPIFRKKLKFKFLTQTQLENDKILSSNVQSFGGFTFSLIEFDHLVNYLTSENYLVRY